MRKINQSYGFTMLEIVVVVTLVGVLLALSAPNLGAFLERRQIQLQAGSINDAFIAGRSVALSTGQTTQICWNTGGAINNLAAANTIVVVETDNAGVQTVSKRVDISGNGFRVSDTGVAGSCVTYNAQGRISNAVSFGVCKIGGRVLDMMTVRVTNTGRPSIIKADKNNPNPNNFSCS